jgi:hypothetical protein
MKIPNPWPYHALSRYTGRGQQGEVVSIISSRDREVEVPDSDEVIIEPVKIIGRGGNVKVLGQGRIWSKEYGLLDLDDHLRKEALKKEEKELQEKQRKYKEKSKKSYVTPTTKSVEVTNTLDLGSGIE